MKNLSNIKADLIKVYNVLNKSEPNTNPNKFNFDIEDLIKSDKPTNNSTSIGFIHTIKASDLDSLSLRYVASKQTQVVI